MLLLCISLLTMASAVCEQWPLGWLAFLVCFHHYCFKGEDEEEAGTEAGLCTLDMLRMVMEVIPKSSWPDLSVV